MSDFEIIGVSPEFAQFNREVLTKSKIIGKIPNFNEIKKLSLEMARQEYEQNCPSPKYRILYQNHTTILGLSKEEFISILSNSYMIKLAIENDYLDLMAIYIYDLLDYRSIYEDRTDKMMELMYDFFSWLIKRNFTK